MIDNGATGFAFIDEDYARCKSLPLHKLKEPRGLEVFDGRPTTSGDITHVAKAQLKIGQHTEALPLFVTKLGHYPMVLGNPWLKLHDVQIGFRANTVTFDSDYCLSHCLKEPIMVSGISSPIPEYRPPVALVGGAAFSRMTTKVR